MAALRLSQVPLARTRATPMCSPGRRLAPRHDSLPCSCMSPSTAFQAATLAVIPLYGAMVTAPRSPRVSQVLASPVIPVAGAAMYIALALGWGAWSELCQLQLWHQGSGPLAWLPSNEGLAMAFTHANLAALTWIHIITLDWLQAR